MNAIVVAVGTWVAKVGVRIARLFAAREVLDSVPKPTEKQPTSSVKTAGAILVIALTGAQGCAVWQRVPACEKLRIAQQLACPADASSSECVEATARLAAECGVKPTPPPPCAAKEPKCILQSDVDCWATGKSGACEFFPAPKPAPTPEPAPIPVDPLPEEPPPAGEAPVTAADCPPIDDGATVFLPVRGPYGKKGFYVELMIRNSPTTCLALNPADPDPQSCHFEGWRTQQRCERYLIKRFGDGKSECPIWWAQTAANGTFRCREDDPFGNSMSCDHFGSADADKRDDPKTVVFEGLPAVCGLQRDSHGKPEAGFFAIVLGAGRVGVSLPGAPGPDNWVAYTEPN